MKTGMKVYKIRRKSDGQYLCGTGYYSWTNEIGRTFSRPQFARSAGRHLRGADDFEIVEFDVTEVNTLPLVKA